MEQRFQSIWQVGLLLLILMAVSAVPAWAQTKFAYVDLQRALNECTAGKRAKGDFRGEIQRLQSKLERQQNEVQSLKDQLDRKGMLMTDEERRNLQDDYTRKLRDFERSYKDSKDELQQKDNEITGAIVRDLAYVVRTMGERDGYTLVFEKGNLLWASTSIDITDQVIREYNAKGGPIGSLGGQDSSGFRTSRGSSSSSSTRYSKRSSISK